jgi:type VII secretion integral membrane protein EccD
VTAAVLPGDLCRVTVVTPTGHADLALPSTIPLAELIPTLLRHANQDPPSAQAVDWVLQRLGEEPFDEDSTLGALAVRDGEVLHLRPRAEAIPTIGFDDIVDGIGRAIGQRPDRWRAAMTRWLFLAAAGCALLTTFAALLMPGDPAADAVAAGVVGGLLTAAAAVWSRAFGDAVAATLLGAAALPFTGACGLQIARTLDGGGLFSGTGLVWAGAVGCVAAAAGLALAVVAVPLYAGAFAGYAGVLIAGLLAGAGLTATQTAAAVCGLAFVLTVLIPAAAARMAGLRLPLLPAAAEDLHREEAVTPAEVVFHRTRRADLLSSAVFVASSAVTTGCAVVLAADRHWLPRALLGVLSTALLVRARILVSAVQRLAVAASGTAAAAALWLALLNSTGSAGRTALLGSLVAAAGLLIVAAHQLPGRTLLPHWGRAADIAEMLLAVAVVPLVLAVLGAYSYARTLLG